MTEAALRLLSRNARGFYLFVEGERRPPAAQRAPGPLVRPLSLTAPVIVPQGAALTKLIMTAKLSWR